MEVGEINRCIMFELHIWQINFRRWKFGTKRFLKENVLHNFIWQIMMFRFGFCWIPCLYVEFQVVWSLPNNLIIWVQQPIPVHPVGPVR